MARNRLNAIKEDRSISTFMKLLNNGEESAESIKPKIDAEIEAAKAAGLNFNIMCHIWLFDVGIQAADSTFTVSKFLNRCLSLRLNKQRLLTNYFMKVMFFGLLKLAYYSPHLILPVILTLTAFGIRDICSQKLW